MADTVAFENRTSAPHVPTFDPHSTHADLPEFDSIDLIAPGYVSVFNFTRRDSKGYNNHLDTAYSATITVEVE